MLQQKQTYIKKLNMYKKKQKKTKKKKNMLGSMMEKILLHGGKN